MSIVNIAASQQAVNNIAPVTAKKEKEAEKTQDAAKPAVEVSVSEKRSMAAKEVYESAGIKPLESESEARAFMDSTKAGMLADAGATIQAQYQQNSDRVSELTS